MKIRCLLGLHKWNDNRVCSICEKENNPRFVKAAIDGDIENIERLLAKGANIEKRGSFGMTALAKAAENGHTHIVDKLLQIGADYKTVLATR